MQSFPCWNLLLMLAVQPTCLSSSFSFSYAFCHELLLFCVYCRAFLCSICSPPAQDRTANVPKHSRFSQSSELLITSKGVGFADTDTEGLCTPPPSYSWSVFHWWYSHGATALPRYYRIWKTVLLCSNPQTAINHPSFFLDISFLFGGGKTPLFKNLKLCFVHHLIYIIPIFRAFPDDW